MLVDHFIALRRPAWERLDTLLQRAGRAGLHALSAEELQELGRLYRLSTSDLARAQRDYPDHRLAVYLNSLVARAHGALYREPATRGRQLREFFVRAFPQSFRATWQYTLVSFLMFFVPALIAYGFGLQNAELLSAVIPGFDTVLADIRAGTEWWLRINEAGRSSSAALIMTNNIRVAFVAFAGGILFGVLTLYVLATNGLSIGGIAGAAHAFGFADNLWGFVAAHGVIELSVIFIAGGAGLQLGWSILRPGLLSRREALIVAARRAVQLILGCAVLLVIAGLIEGFISPSALPVAVKYAVAVLSGVLLYSYLLLSGRPSRRR